MTVLNEANALVDGARRETYGTPLENHTRTAQMWSAYLGVVVSPRDVCMLNAMQKISRDRHRAHRDNLVDVAGYMRNAELCELAVEPNPKDFYAAAARAHARFYEKPAHDTGREDGRDPPP